MFTHVNKTPPPRRITGSEGFPAVKYNNKNYLSYPIFTPIIRGNNNILTTTSHLNADYLQHLSTMQVLMENTFFTLTFFWTTLVVCAFLCSTIFVFCCNVSSSKSSTYSLFRLCGYPFLPTCRKLELDAPSDMVFIS